MTDAELIAQLRNSKGWPTLGHAAADRIEALAALHQAAVQDALAAEAYAEELNDRVRNMIDRIEYLVAQNDQLEAKLAQAVIAEYDDGSQMHLFSHAGGASVGGAWSELTIRHDLPDGTSMLRDYKAAGDWYSFPVAETEGNTLEAKLAKAVKFLEFLDENYRHVFGDTARAKFAQLYAELKGNTDD